MGATELEMDSTLHNTERAARRRTFSRALLGLFFIGAGSLHFLLPETYASVVPPALPAHLLLVQISGVAEIAGGLGVLVPTFRMAAGWALIALLVAVFPANIYMAMRGIEHPVAPLLLFVLLIRLPLQLVIIAWVYRATGLRSTRSA